MDAHGARVRRRGFFLHSETTGEPETGEHDTPEGLAVRARISRGAPVPRQVAGSGGRSHAESRTDDSDPQIRSGSVTGSRQRVHSLR
jgi:hypothetical protein